MTVFQNKINVKQLLKFYFLAMELWFSGEECHVSPPAKVQFPETKISSWRKVQVLAEFNRKVPAWFVHVEQRKSNSKTGYALLLYGYHTSIVLLS